MDFSDPNTIPNYLEKYFKQKEATKKQRQMMGDDSELRAKVQDLQEKSQVQKKKVDVSQFRKEKKQAMGVDQNYISSEFVKLI